MNKKLRFLIFAVCIIFVVNCIPFGVTAGSMDVPTFTYSAHISNIGWMDEVTNGQTAGVIGNLYRLESLKFNLNGEEDLDINCGVHVQSIGWMNETSVDETAGTVGKSLAIEGIYISLTGSKAENYDIWYRTNIKNYGWLGWAKNGENSGSVGFSLPIQQIEIKISLKDTFIPTDNTSAFKTAILKYSSHVSNVGWMTEVYDNQASGIIDGSKRIEALNISLLSKDDIKLIGGIHVENIGWMNNITSTNLLGTTGRSLRAEGFYLYLTGSDADKYDIWYRSCIDYYGWLGWAKNGEKCGSQGISATMQGVQIFICPKDSFTPDTDETAFKTTLFCYKSHVSNIGWMDNVIDGQTSGTADNTHNTEALVATLKGYGDLTLTYSAHVQNIGWMDTVSSGSTAGTTGRSLSVEAVCFNLDGSEADKYDIRYRAYMKNKGWLDWAKNGEKCGSQGMSTPISGIEIKLCKKGEFTPQNNWKPENDVVSLSYAVNTKDNDWLDYADLGQTAGNSNAKDKIQGIKMQLSGSADLHLSYSAHISNIGWTEPIDNSSSDGIVNKNEQIEAIRMELTGSSANEYDIWYNVCIKGYGWLGWAKNGEDAGSSGISYPMYAVNIIICKKDTFVPPFYGDIFETEKLGKPVNKVFLFAIDAGHGGGDSGAIGLGGRYEANDTIKIANEVIRILNQQGQNTYLINRSLATQDRPVEANSVNADFFISLHRDSTNQTYGPSGISIYTHEPNHIQRQQQPEKNYAPNEQANKHELDDALVNNLRNYLSEVSPIPIKGVYYGSASAPTWEDYYINRISNMPSCIVELGFVNNASDNANFDASYKTLAKAIVKALMATAGLTFNEQLYTAN